MTSTQWVEYHNGTKRKSYNTLPTSNITAEAVTVDGFTLSQADNAGVTTTNTRSYTANGMIQTRTDGRGNTPTTVTDTAGRTLTVTDAQGNTSCYRYDARGRKLAEWGTGMQPVCFGYDEADRMTSLTTSRATAETVTTDPNHRTDGDVTLRSYHNVSGMETAKTYADNLSVVKTYDAYNRVLTETDAAGVRTLGHNAYVKHESDSLVADSVTHLITETRDDKGRSTGCTYAKNGSVQQTVTTGYSSDGRIACAGFLHGGEQKIDWFSVISWT